VGAPAGGVAVDAFFEQGDDQACPGLDFQVQILSSVTCW
jgi:hypothetical protein